MTVVLDSMVYVVEKDSKYWNGRQFIRNALKAKHYKSRGSAMRGVIAANKTSINKRIKLNLNITKIDSKPYRTSIDDFNNFWNELQSRMK